MRIKPLHSYASYDCFKRPQIFSYLSNRQVLFATGRNIIDKSISSVVTEDVTWTEEEVYDLALGDPVVFAQELSMKVEAAIEEEMNRKEGVNTVKNDRQPLMKAHLDLLTYSGRQEFIKGNFTGALEIYNRCIEYNPADGRAWLGIARIYWKTGGARRAALAEKAYKDGLSYNPKNPYLLQAYAVMLVKLGQLKEAQKLLIGSVKSNPSHAASWCTLADINFRNGDIGTARFCYSSAVENDPQSYVALQAWGQLESNKRWGDPSKARSLFRRAILVSGNQSVHSYHAWAILERREGDLNESQRLLNTALELFPRSTRVLLALAELTEMRGGRSREATEKVRRIFKEGFDTAVAIGDAGFVQAWAMFEQRVLAQQEWLQKKGRAREMSHSDTSSADEQVEEELGHGDDGEGGDEESGDGMMKMMMDELAARKEEEDEEYGKQRADFSVERRLQQVAAIRRLFNRAIAINKFHSASWIAWAKFEQKFGNTDVARKLLITGIANFPTSKNIAWFHCALGSLALQQAKDAYNTSGMGLPVARACYQRALSASPPHQSLSILLAFARVEINFGSLKEAARLLELAQKRFPGDPRLTTLQSSLSQQQDSLGPLKS